MRKNLLHVDTILDRKIKLPTYKSVLFRATVAFLSVFIFLSALQPKQLFLNQLNLNGTIICVNLAFTTAIVHILIWFSVIALYKNEAKIRWNAFKSLVLKCFIGFTILCCLYLNARALGLDVDLAFFILWGLIMSPSFAIAMILYEINQSLPKTSENPITIPVEISPTFELSTTDSFLYAITCKKASSLDSSLSTLSNGIFLHFETEVKLQNTTLSNFSDANSHFKELVRCHDSYIVNLQKIQRFDQVQGLLIISEKQIPISKKGGKGIASIAEISEKLTSYTQNK